MIISGAPNCGITYDCHSDDSRGVIYVVNDSKTAGNVECHVVIELGMF
jgi:hypothetical protein